jgi:hypothetical protein
MSTETETPVDDMIDVWTQRPFGERGPVAVSDHEPEPSDDLVTETRWMSRAEFDALPEFNGF